MSVPQAGSPLNSRLPHCAPVRRIAEAMGDLWVPPAPHKGGKIDILENSHGVVINLDRALLAERKLRGVKVYLRPMSWTGSTRPTPFD